MAATSQALLGRFEAALVSGLSVPNAFNGSENPGPNLDLFQIANPGDITSGQANTTPVGHTITCNVDYKGVVNNPAVSPTNGTRLGIFWTTSPDASSTALLFSTAFANAGLIDIVQTVVEGGNIAYWLDYLGVAHGA